VGLIALFLLNGCSSVYYLYQAGRGQLKLINRARPLDEVIADPTTDVDLVELLKKIPEIKKYGEASGLKATKNYREYVKLDEDAVVYVVTVSDPLEFKPTYFSFPIVGSFNYIGWFSRQDAKKFASKYEEQGLDVDVRGASAYSTLGWFNDPLLSSMIPKENGKVSEVALPEMVNVVLHESVHATLYINNQSYFNESLAFFLADILTERYFKDHGLLESKAWKSYLESKANYEKVQKRMAQAFQDLKTIYESKDSKEEKIRLKKNYIEALQKELGFRRPINNATLIQFQTYDPSDHGFSELFKKTHEDVRSFLQVLSKLKEKDFKHPHEEELRGLIEQVSRNL
jgi:predicted aminopeptidase